MNVTFMVLQSEHQQYRVQELQCVALVVKVLEKESLLASTSYFGLKSMNMTCKGKRVMEYHGRSS